MADWKSNRTHRHHLPTAVLGLACDSGEGDKAYAACMDGVYELNLSNGEYRYLYSHDSYASGVHFLADQQTLISCGYDGTVRWFDTGNQSLLDTQDLFDFWCWDMRGVTFNDSHRIVVGSGQYLAGDYQYHPQPSQQPTVKVLDAIHRSVQAQFSLTPPVQAVAISHDGRHVAAANLMGDIAVWDTETGTEVARWNTPDFTAFGIIKSHCQIGGIYSMMFTSERELLVCGMGPMRDPMAGNGKQRWQRFAWCERDEVERTAQSKDDQVGEGLMETLCFSPDGQYFVMAGRLRGGAWSTGLFQLESGDLEHSIKSDSRVTEARFHANGKRLCLAGAINQSADPEHKFGVVDLYDVTRDAE